MNVEKAFSGCPLSKISYHMKGFPTKRSDTGSLRIKYYAHIESMMNYTENEQNIIKEYECGDAEVDVQKYYCRLRHCTIRGSRFQANYIASLIICVFLS